MVDIRRELATFSPLEFEAASGLALSTQRDWRRRGYLADHKGRHAKFSVFELAETYLFKHMSKHNFGPATARRLARLSAKSVVWYAIDSRQPLIIGSRKDKSEYNLLFKNDIRELELSTGIEEAEVGKYVVDRSDGACVITSDEQVVFQILSGIPSLCLDLEDFSKIFNRGYKGPLVTIYLGSESLLKRGKK